MAKFGDFRTKFGDFGAKFRGVLTQTPQFPLKILRFDQEFLNLSIKIEDFDLKLGVSC